MATAKISKDQTKRSRSGHPGPAGHESYLQGFKPSLGLRPAPHRTRLWQLQVISGGWMSLALGSGRCEGGAPFAGVIVTAALAANPGRCPAGELKACARRRLPSRSEVPS